MYKDPDKQREANRERQRRYKERQKALQSEGVTDKALPGRTGVNLDALGLAEAPNSIGGTKLVVKPKRGKDIKCFNDLPPDVQATIDRISESNEEKAKRTKAAIKYQHLFPDRFHSTG